MPEPLREYAHPSQNGPKSGIRDTSNPSLTPSSSWGMGPGGRRPSHLSAEDQIVPTSGLRFWYPSALEPGFRPSRCNEATRLGLQWEGKAPSVQWRLVYPETYWLLSHQRWAPTGLPSLLGRVSLWIGVTCKERVHTQPTVLFLDQASLRTAKICLIGDSGSIQAKQEFSPKGRG